MTAANAVEEAARSENTMKIPYWRTIKADGYLNEKYPGGQEGHKRLLEEEGHKVITLGKRYQVADFQKRPVSRDLGGALKAGHPPASGPEKQKIIKNSSG
jgi:hypothetical protein